MKFEGNYGVTVEEILSNKGDFLRITQPDGREVELRYDAFNEVVQISKIMMPDWWTEID